MIVKCRLTIKSEFKIIILIISSIIIIILNHVSVLTFMMGTSAASAGDLIL